MFTYTYRFYPCSSYAAMVLYGAHDGPSFSHWMVPGTWGGE